MMVYRILLLILTFSFSIRLVAQLSISDSTTLYSARNNAISKALMFQRAINVGSEYDVRPIDFKEGHQFFLTGNEFDGDIQYCGVFYSKVSLQYDLVRDQIVTKNYAGRKIVLVKEKVDWFTIDGHVFRKYSNVYKDDKARVVFLEILVDDDRVRLLAKRIKKVKGNSGEFYFKDEKRVVEESTEYFILKDGSFFPVKNHDKIKKLLMTSDSGYRNINTGKPTREERMIDIVRQYIQLKK